MALVDASYDSSLRLCADNRVDGGPDTNSRVSYRWLKWAIVWSVATVLSIGGSFSIIAAAILIR